MNNLANWLTVVEVVCLVLASGLILLQNRGAGLSSTFGGSNQIYITRRGIERWVVFLTVFCIIVFVIVRIFSLYLV